MNFVTILAIVATVLTAGAGAVVALFSVRSDFRAQRDLVRRLAAHDRAVTLRRLQQARDDIAKASPDQAKLEDASAVVQGLASELPKREARAVRAHLNQGSEVNAAAYVVSLIDEADQRSSTMETGASA